jgi:hypothetical protein
MEPGSRSYEGRKCDLAATEIIVKGATQPRL